MLVNIDKCNRLQNIAHLSIISEYWYHCSYL